MRQKKEPVKPKILMAPPKISIRDMIKQATYIGCYLTDRDLCQECFPSQPTLSSAKKAVLGGKAYGTASACVISVELKKQRDGRQSIKATLAHEETIINAYVNKKERTKKDELPQPGEIVLIQYRGRIVESAESGPSVSMSINHLQVFGNSEPFCTSTKKGKSYGRSKKRY